jgi:hypothetical protein
MPSAVAAVATASPSAPSAFARGDHRLVSALGLAGAYVALGTWMWFAWYADQPARPHLRYGGDGLFGAETYAGGSDKLGHVWANLALSRLGAEVLGAGGWDRGPSILMASGICLSAFALVEVNDGFYTELSPGDLGGNAIGAALAIAMSSWPAFDAAIDFRAQWLPSRAFLREPSPNFAEDYSGQTYLLAYKLSSIRALTHGNRTLRWLQFLNPVVGFESRNYKPAPAAEDEPLQRRQNLFLGITFDLQVAISTTERRDISASAKRRYRAAHAFFEVFNLPLSTVPVLTLSRSRD